MSLDSSKLDLNQPGEKSALWRIGKYVLFRLIVLLITVVITVYLTILIANWGGAMDEAVKANIQLAVFSMTRSGWLQDTTEQEKEEIINQTAMEMEEAAGLNEPFMLRSIRWLIKGITFDWGVTRARISQNRSESKDIKLIILESLPRTLLIFGLAYLFLFFISIFLALYITKLYGGWLDKIMISLSPLSAAPAWIFGILLNFFFLKIVGSSFFSGGGFDAWPSEFKFSYIGMLLKQMAIPFVAILISGIFQAVYSWRTFFLIYSNEDYVEMAKAKGLPNWTLNRRYILKPLLPSIITSFALLFIVLWQEVIALEYIFNVDGIGSLLLFNIKRIPPNTTLIVAIVVTFAYLLAITVFLLDLIYAFVDPRVSIGGLQRNNHRIQRRDHDPLLGKIKRLFQPSHAGKSSLLEKVQSKELPGSGAKLKTGESMLDEIFRAFWVEKKAQAVRLVDHHTGRKMVVDRLYPELGLAFLFSSDEDQAVKVYLEAFKRTDIHLIVMDPHQPLSPGSINEIQHCLSSSARRIALGRKPHQEKAAWMLRINEAKSAVLWYREVPKPTIDIHIPQINKWKNWNRKFNKKLKIRVKQFSEYPSAIIGLVIITIMIGISFFTVVNVPYDEMIVLWRSSNEAWRKLPRDAAPAWVNIFRRNDLPYTIQLNSRSANTMLNEEIGNTDFVTKTITPISEEMTEILISYTFEYKYNSFPQDIAVFIDVQYEEKLPLITITLVTPDDRELKIDSFIPNKKNDVYYFTRQEILRRKFKTEFPVNAILSDPNSETLTPLNGTYNLQIKAFVFEDDSDMEAELVVYGQVYGIAGTDGKRRDIMIPLLWGMPIALSFGILAAVGTSFSSMLIAALSTWFGGWIDNLTQRITEINLILPFLPVSIMIYVLYSKSFWTILGVSVILNIFGNEIKNYRSIFLQIMEEKYIEAAQSYGAKGWRIITRYLIPRIMPIMIPKLVILVPSYVFLEATLTLLGISDPVMPTWGKLLVEGFSSDIYRGVYHLFLEPLALLLLVGFAFVLLGISLERIFQPRLREQ